MRKSPKTAKYLLTPVQLAGVEKNPWDWYKSFVYESGKIGQESPEKETTASQSPKPAERPLIVQSAKEKCQELQLDGKLINRIRNLSEGLIAGTAKMVARLQEKLQRNPREPRELWEGSPFFTTRVFHRPRLSV
jgi:hypothetical protein